MRRLVRLGIGLGFSMAMLALLFLVLSVLWDQPATTADASSDRSPARTAHTRKEDAWSPTVPYAIQTTTTQDDGQRPPARASNLPYAVTGRVLDAGGRAVVGLRLELWAGDGSRRLTFARITTGPSGTFHAVASTPVTRLRLASGVTIPGSIGAWPDPQGVVVTAGTGSQTTPVVIQLLSRASRPAPLTTPSTTPTSLAPPLTLPPSPPTSLAPPLTLPPSTPTTARPSTTAPPPTTPSTAATTTAPQTTSTAPPTSTTVRQTSTTVGTTTTTSPSPATAVAPG